MLHYNSLWSSTVGNVHLRFETLYFQLLSINCLEGRSAAASEGPGSQPEQHQPTGDRKAHRGRSARGGSLHCRGTLPYPTLPLPFTITLMHSSVQRNEVNVEKYFRYNFSSIMNSRQLVRYVVLSVDPIVKGNRPSARVRGAMGSKVRSASVMTIIMQLFSHIF